jgi:hypothetical protein
MPGTARLAAAVPKKLPHWKMGADEKRVTRSSMPTIRRPRVYLAGRCADARACQMRCEAGFEVTLVLDKTTDQARKALEDFAETSAVADASLIYIGGHARSTNASLLMMGDYPEQDAKWLPTHAISVDDRPGGQGEGCEPCALRQLQGRSFPSPDRAAETFIDRQLRLFWQDGPCRRRLKRYRNGIAHAFRRNGATVHVGKQRSSARDYAGEEGSDLAGLTYAQMDVSDFAAIDYAPPFKTLDVLVNCQGTVIYKRGEFDRRLPARDRRQPQQRDGLRHEVPCHVRCGKGWIIISSTSAYHTTLGNPAYGTSKAVRGAHQEPRPCSPRKASAERRRARPCRHRSRR